MTTIFGTGKFDFRKRALIKCRAPFDFTDETSIIKFDVGGTQPANTERRIIFEIDGELYRFVNGILDKYVWRGNFDDILIYGNTVGELLQLQNINAFVGKKVYPIIALDAPSNADVYPKLNLQVKVSSYNDIYTCYKFSPVFELPENARIISVRKIATTQGNATELTECRLKKVTGWTDWQNYIFAENQTASAIQFRTKFIVSTLDETDEAQIDKIEVNYTDDFNCDASNQQYFFTKTENYDADLHTCYLLIKHAPFNDATLSAYVSLKPARARVENYPVGTADGLKTFNLPRNFILQDTLSVEVDGVPTFDFDFDTQNSTLTLQGTGAVTVSFDYAPAENWLPMKKDFAALDKTRFTFTTTAANLRDAACRFTAQGKLPQITGYIAGFAV